MRRVLEFTGQTPNDWQTGFFPCAKCKYCTYAFYTHSVREGPNSYPILHRSCCSDKDLIYLIVCRNCSVRYVGETSRPLRVRISEHVNNILSFRSTSVSDHFISRCSLNDFSFTALERCRNTTRRRNKEARWMRRLNTLAPHGLNGTDNTKKSVHLVLPYSACSERILRLCQARTRDVTTTGSFTSARNLRSLFKPSLS